MMNVTLAEFLADNLALVLVLAAWELFWKYLALWRAARRNQPGWFVVLAIVNSLGILSIFYLFSGYGKTQDSPKQPESPESKE